MTQVEFEERADLAAADVLERTLRAAAADPAAPPAVALVGLTLSAAMQLAARLFLAHREAAMKLARYADLLDEAPAGEVAGGLVAGELRALSHAMQDDLHCFAGGKGVGTCSDPA